jgi:hypothetical protein
VLTRVKRDCSEACRIADIRAEREQGCGPQLWPPDLYGTWGTDAAERETET